MVRRRKKKPPFVVGYKGRTFFATPREPSGMGDVGVPVPPVIHARKLAKLRRRSLYPGMDGIVAAAREPVSVVAHKREGGRVGVVPHLRRPPRVRRLDMKELPSFVRIRLDRALAERGRPFSLASKREADAILAVRQFGRAAKLSKKTRPTTIIEFQNGTRGVAIAEAPPVVLEPPRALPGDRLDSIERLRKMRKKREEGV